MVAWLDRPYERKRDLQDFGTILSRTLGEDDTRRWDPGIPADFEDQSAFYVGQEVGKVIRVHHKEVIDRFLESVLSDEGNWCAEVGKGMETARYAERNVRAFLEGLEAAGAQAR